MPRNEIIDNLKNIICDYVDVDKNSISNDFSLSSDIGLDSFSLLSIISDIEDRFCIRIENDKLMTFHSFCDIVNYIEHAF